MSQKSRINLSLRYEISDDQEQNIEACSLVISELNHTVKDQVCVMILKEVLHRQKLEVQCVNTVLVVASQ